MPETNIYISVVYKWQNASSQYLHFTYLQVTECQLSIFTFHLRTSDRIPALNIYISLIYKWQCQTNIYISLIYKWQNASSQYLHFTYVQVTEYQLSIFTFHLFTTDRIPALNIYISLIYKATECRLSVLTSHLCTSDRMPELGGSSRGTNQHVS